MKYQFIEQYKQEFPVAVMCQVLEVSESGFYAWRKRPACRHHQEDAQLMQEIRQVFLAHRGRYGSPRIHSELKDQGRHIARKRVARLMREAEMYAGCKRRRVQTTRRDATHPVAPNVLNRAFTAAEPNTRMGDRYHLYPNNTRMALSCGDAGLVFKSRGGMVDVRLLR